MTQNPIFQSYDLRALRLANRIVMAPLTRDRAGLMIAEATRVQQGYRYNPDLVTRLQTGAAPAAINPATIYRSAAKGYADDPALTAVAA